MISSSTARATRLDPPFAQLVRVGGKDRPLHDRDVLGRFEDQIAGRVSPRQLGGGHGPCVPGLQLTAVAARRPALRLDVETPPRLGVRRRPAGPAARTTICARKRLRRDPRSPSPAAASDTARLSLLHHMLEALRPAYRTALHGNTAAGDDVVAGRG